MSSTAHFTHLRVHSHFSLLGGMASPDALAQQAAASGLKTLALTDTFGLYGAVAFSRACRAADIKPLTGLVVPVAAPDNPPPIDASTPGQLILLATGPAGYRSLNQLSTLLLGSPEQDRLRHGLTWADLRAHSDGLICLDGGRRGWLDRFVRAGHDKAATHVASMLGGIYEERAYIGVEWHEPADTAVISELIRIGARFGLPPAAAQPIYCLHEEERPLLRLLAAIDQNCHLDHVSPHTLPGFDDAQINVHWLPPAEVVERFAAFPEAIANVGAIVDQCQPCLPNGRPLWPALDLPEGQTVAQALAQQAEEGLEKKQSTENSERGTDNESPATRHPPPAYQTRLQRELTAINHHGFAPLFLVVADVVAFARETGVPVSTRGSVANSLAAYALGITTVDPVANGLLFERFLNPARTTLPDIDLDFCSRRRDEVLHYVVEKYGADQVALVATISTMQPKSAVRETAKAHGLSETQIKRLSKLIPRGWHPDPGRREEVSLPDLLAQIEDAQEREVFATAYRLVGQPHHLSVHPGGVVITPGPLTDTVAAQWTTKGFLTTQFDHRDLETIGLPKLDLLGIRALTVLADTAVSVRAAHDPAFQLEAIPLDDEATGNAISHGDTIGVFQCESSGAQRTLRQLRAKSVWDLAVANAFFKPGPATGGMAAAFVRRYRGEEAVSFLHPALEPILGPTQGVMLFQEQVLRVAVEIAGLSWAQAERLRKGMSKFQPKEMAALRLAFIHGCQRPAPDGPAFTQEQANTLWEQVSAFAGYGFNQGHATAYADVSYRSAYLKTHYPAEFLCARLADHGGFHHPAIYLAEARRVGIGTMPPHVNFSGWKFTLVASSELQVAGKDDSPLATRHSQLLWMGLGQVRDLRHKSIEEIVGKRPFSSLRDLLDRVELQGKEITHLIQCGALDGMGTSRAALLADAEEILRAGSARQMSFGFGLETAVPPESPAQRFDWEMHLLGLPMSVHPLDLLQKRPKTLPIRQLPQHLGKRVTLGGTRLPGWTGGQGFFLDDGESYVIVRGLDKEKPEVWGALVVNGRLRQDEWGTTWFQAESVTLV
ncbi:MAG: DNA polymerase III subunit alpha [Chloroflexota bacterium]